MNFLAHVYWSDGSPEALAGSLMPDLVHGRLPRDLPAATLEGIRQHRRLDALTDTHPLCLTARERLREHHGRLAGILLDVFFDHALATDWSHHHPQPLGVFVARVYDGLRQATPIMPPTMSEVVTRMAAEDWLGGYVTLAGMRLTLTRLSARLVGRVGLAIDVDRAIDDLATQTPTLTRELAAYFDWLRQMPEPIGPGGLISGCPRASLPERWPTADANPAANAR